MESNHAPLLYQRSVLPMNYAPMFYRLALPEVLLCRTKEGELRTPEFVAFFMSCEGDSNPCMTVLQTVVLTTSPPQQKRLYNFAIPFTVNRFRVNPHLYAKLYIIWQNEYIKTEINLKD